MELTDAALVEDCLSGRKESFSELVRRHQDGVFNMALRMTNNRTDARDLAQETFIRAFRKLGTYRPEYSFKNWVLTICSNLTKNRFRGNARRRLAEKTHAELEQLLAPHRDPRHEAFERALRDLDTILRVPLVLKHVEGLSYEEVSHVLGIGISAAKMRVKRGREKLMETLGVAKGDEQR